MDANDAVALIERYVETYRAEHADFLPREVTVLPSGDETDAVKLLVHFPEETPEREARKRGEALVKALRKAHPELAAIKVRLRADAF